MIALATFVALAGALFIYVLVSTPKQESAPTTQASSTEDTAPMIVAKHQYRQGTHVLVGSLHLPKACDQLAAEPFFAGESTTTVQVRFTTVSATGTCEAEFAPTPFRVTVNAPEQTVWSATWNGTPAILNLIPVPANESLDGAVDVKG